MAEVRVQLPDDSLAELKATLGLRTNVQVVEEALLVLNWIAEEKRKGRDIFSAAPDGTHVVRLWTKALRNTAPA